MLHGLTGQALNKTLFVQDATQHPTLTIYYLTLMEGANMQVELALWSNSFL